MTNRKINMRINTFFILLILAFSLIIIGAIWGNLNMYHDGFLSFTKPSSIWQRTQSFGWAYVPIFLGLSLLFYLKRVK